MKFFHHLILCMGLIFQCVCNAKPTLKIYTFSAMSSQYGSGPYLKEAFEKQYNCHIQWIPFDTGIILLNRLKWEGAKTKADLVLGLDNITAQEALDLNIFEDLGQPQTFGQSQLIPYSRVSLAFIYEQTRLPEPPSSFEDLLGGNYTLLLQDPRTSGTGTAIVSWIRQIYGDKAPEVWKKLQPKILTFTRSWSEAYTLFQRGEGDLVLSYSSSPLYHEIQEGNTNYRAAIFKEGNLTLYEMGGITKTSQHKELAKHFIQFLRSPMGQTILATKGWQYPFQGKPKEWESCVTYQEPNKFIYSLRSFNRMEWVKEWKNSLKR